MRRPLPLLLLALTALALSGCSSLLSFLGGARPDATFKRMNLQGFDLEGVTLGLVYEIDNPYDIGIKIAEVDYQLEVEGRRVFRGSPNEGVQIPARGTRDVTFPAQIRFADVVPAARTIFTQGKFNYRASGSMGLATPVGVVRIPLSKSGNFDSPSLPKIRIADIKAPKVSATGAELQVALDVTNGNPFPLPLESVDYGLNFNGSRVGGGTARGTSVATGQTRRITLPVKVDLLGAGKAVLPFLQGRSADVALTGKMDFGSVTGPLKVSEKVAGKK